ncbi:MAG: ATP-binding protein [Clostridia bacterium]|nr:ATP-binding protein [Clostridia bacterium]
MQITKGRIKTALKVVVYGPEGIGKTTFASQLPSPVFIDTEGSTKHMDVTRTDPSPESWEGLKGQVKHFILHPEHLKTLVIDTMDWAEKLCITALCDKAKVDGIEGYGYG